MHSFRITPFRQSEKYSLEIENFEPPEGYEGFLQSLCHSLNEEFLDWYQGVESGIGHITYRNYKLTVYWTDFPFALSFDCVDEAMANSLKEDLDRYFA